MELVGLKREQTKSEPDLNKRTRSTRQASMRDAVFSLFDTGPPALKLSPHSRRERGTRVQPRLPVSHPGDRYEQEADRVAAQVISTGRHADADQLVTEAKPQAISIQRKPETDDNTGVSISEDFQPSLGSGQPLDPSTREFFQSRLGNDLNDVRIHTGAEAAMSAESINARAYTSGRDVVFASGEYQPDTEAGRELLAHELTHTIQQQGATQPTIQRKLKVGAGLALDTMGFSTSKTGDVYTCPAIVKNSVWNEIFTSLLFSPRTFTLDGATNEAINANLKKHMASRLGIIEFASKKKYTFAAGTAFRMNPAYWIVDYAAGRFDVKPGVDRAKAIADLNVNPKEYAIACEAATALTVEGGGKSPVTDDTGVASDDWIPGDWGYIENTKFPTDGTGTPGLEGENLIYVGKDNFWGHFGPGIEYKTLQKWFDQVKSWGDARIATYRTRPVIGLK